MPFWLSRYMEKRLFGIISFGAERRSVGVVSAEENKPTQVKKREIGSKK